MATMVFIQILCSLLLSCFSSSVFAITDANDFKILNEFREGLKNPELLKWPSDNTDPCGPPLWPNVYCAGSRVAQIQVQNFGLIGPLPQSFNKLSMLYNIGLQGNKFNGALPTFAGLSKLKYAFLNDNQFDSIPSDFFIGLDSLEVLALNNNPLNKSNGWMLPKDIQNSVRLMNLSLINCNMVGRLPDCLGGMLSLKTLQLSYNSLTGEVPKSYSNLILLQTLWLNNQAGDGLSGSLDVIASMNSLVQAWLHGNSFSGPVPSSFGGCTYLTELWLNNNKLVGLIPMNLISLPKLSLLKLDNNMLMGPIPKVNYNFTYSGNSFCQDTPGVDCSPHVNALLDFIGNVNYPLNLASSWSGNDPCNDWLGILCSSGDVITIILPNSNLVGKISPLISNLSSLSIIRLDNNGFTGVIPETLTSLEKLTLLNVSSNNLKPPIPRFGRNVKLIIDANPLLSPNASTSPSPSIHPTINHTSPPVPNSPLYPPLSPPSNLPSSPPSSLPSSQPSSLPLSPPSGAGTPNISSTIAKNSHSKSLILMIVVPTLFGILIILLVTMSIYCMKQKKIEGRTSQEALVVYPKDSFNKDTKIAVFANDVYSRMVTSSDSGAQSESRNSIVSVEIIRNITNNFSKENEIGRGGFGVVYKGELHDGTKFAVKRMESAKISNNAMNEFEAEIAVLTKVRHKNLVSLLGYSIEGNEKLLVYEYMPQGALSKHLFHWRQFNLEPLSWKKRLSIALDVARGMEYLHSLTHDCFIHRDLKSSNILLGDDLRAKVSDFGLVKLAPDGKNSVATRLAGTFGYLAPEYAVTGKITTKADVFSFGVVLMELITGLTALDESRPETSRYLASWFIEEKSNIETLKSSVDSSIELTEETLESMQIVAELAGHCAAREPYQRPDMCHVVNVLSPLVEKWTPSKGKGDECLTVDLQKPLLQLVKSWESYDSQDGSLTTGVDDSQGSIPVRPSDFGRSFTSSDGR